jgi:5-methylcytosine-specific restriction protein A
VRAQVLEEEPFCRCDVHQGREDAPASTVVDHIIPHRGDEELKWRRSNLRGMAKRCHDAKTAREDGAFGNPLRQQVFA